MVGDNAPPGSSLLMATFFLALAWCGVQLEHPAPEINYCIFQALLSGDLCCHAYGFCYGVSICFQSSSHLLPPYYHRTCHGKYGWYCSVWARSNAASDTCFDFPGGFPRWSALWGCELVNTSLNFDVHFIHSLPTYYILTVYLKCILYTVLSTSLRYFIIIISEIWKAFLWYISHIDICGGG